MPTQATLRRLAREARERGEIAAHEQGRDPNMRLRSRVAALGGELASMWGFESARAFILNLQDDIARHGEDPAK